MGGGGGVLISCLFNAQQNSNEYHYNSKKMVFGLARVWIDGVQITEGLLRLVNLCVCTFVCVCVHLCVCLMLSFHISRT